MKTSCRLALLCAAAILTQAALAEPLNLKAKWNCPQTVSTEIPVEAEVAFTVDTSSRIAVSEALDKFFSTAEKTPDIDYYNCFQRAFTQFGYSLANWCRDEGKSASFCPSFRFTDFLDENKTIANKIRIYGQKTYQRGALGPFEPAGKTQRAQSEEFQAKLAEQITKHCRLTMMSPEEFLDGEFLKKDLPDLVKKSACEKNELARQYQEILLKTQLDQTQCQKFPEPCAKRRMAAAKALALLAKAGVVSPEYDESLLSLEKSYRMLTDKFTCTKLEENSNVRVTQEEGSGIWANFTLQRLSDETLSEDYDDRHGKIVTKGTKVASYVAHVDLSFKKPGEKEADAELTTVWKARARTCYESEPALSKLRGPNGERLRISLWDGSADVKTPPPVQVTILDNPNRTNMLNWSPDIVVPDPQRPGGERLVCSEIVHETLHLLSLRDLYGEDYSGHLVTPDGDITSLQDKPSDESLGESKFVGKYDCRVKGPIASMMHHETLMYEGVSSMKSKVTSCVCDKALPKKQVELCVKKLASLKVLTKGCPKGTVERVDEYSNFQMRGEEPGKLRNRYELTMKMQPLPPEHGSLLRPAEFRVITNPGCMEENARYYLCTEESYKTSRGAYGSDSCAKALPKECLDPDPEVWLK